MESCSAQHFAPFTHEWQILALSWAMYVVSFVKNMGCACQTNLTKRDESAMLDRLISCAFPQIGTATPSLKTIACCFLGIDVTCVLSVGISLPLNDVLSCISTPSPIHSCHDPSFYCPQDPRMTLSAFRGIRMHSQLALHGRVQSSTG